VRTAYGSYQLWYQQGFDNGKIKIKIGQIATVNEFGATDFFDLLVNDALGYAPNAIFNTRQPFSPAAKPGFMVTGSLSDLTPGLYFKGGVFTSLQPPIQWNCQRIGHVDYSRLTSKGRSSTASPLFLKVESREYLGVDQDALGHALPAPAIYFCRRDLMNANVLRFLPSAISLLPQS
jgi:Carbohydrate-selective porin, OprB family